MTSAIQSAREAVEGWAVSPAAVRNRGCAISSTAPRS
jgi:hypothetical protein